MRKLMVAIGTALLLTVAAGAQDQAPNWQIDPNHSVATFEVVHMGLSHVEGHFSKVKGGGFWHGKSFKDASLSADIDLSSVDTRVENRDKDLRSSNFFDVEHYPTMSFKSRRIRDKGKGHIELLGDLTLHGVTRPILLDATVSGPVKDPYGNNRIGAHATGSLNRMDYGLLWNHLLDNGNAVVSNNVDITLDVEMIQPGPKGKGYQASVPGSPLKGPTTSDVIQPP